MDGRRCYEASKVDNISMNKWLKITLAFSAVIASYIENFMYKYRRWVSTKTGIPEWKLT